MLPPSPRRGYNRWVTDKPHPFHVIDGTPPPDTAKERRLARIRKAKPAELIRCPRCQGNAMLQVKLGMVYVNGKASGGQKTTVCAMCLSRGEYVAVTI